MANRTALADQTRTTEVDRIIAAFNARLAIYRAKCAQADPLAEDDRNRHEALRYVIEAIEVLARECGLAGSVPTDDYLA